MHMLGNIVSRPLRDRICKIVAFCLSTICAGVKGLSCYVPAVCLFSSVLRLGGGATCSHLPLPNPHIYSSAKANLLPHLTALKSFIPSTPVRCNIWLLETILLVLSPPPFCCSSSQAGQQSPDQLIFCHRETVKKKKNLTYFNQLWTH